METTLPVEKTYPAHGPIQQFRFSQATAFTCFRCGFSKKSKLITVYGGDQKQRLCNGCYGRLLSLYDIKCGTASEHEKIEALADALFSIVAVDEQRRAEQLFKVSESRSQLLSPEALRFVATSEYIAGQLDSAPQLEWSPAIIGMCKAVELEVVNRLIRPLSNISANQDLTSDKTDKDLGRIASFCLDPNRKPPELGTFSHFLQTIIYSQKRRKTSNLIQIFLKLTTQLVGSHWILDYEGLHKSLTLLISNFRNKAAHIDELSKEDYNNCRDLVIGDKGILWLLIVSTDSHK